MSRESKDRLVAILEVVIEICGVLIAIWPLVKPKKPRK